MRHTLSAVLFVLLIPAAAFAQTAASPPAVQFDQVLSANPLGVVVKWFNVEYERKLGTATTVGAVGVASRRAGFIATRRSCCAGIRNSHRSTGFYLGARAGAFSFKTFTYEFRS